MSIPTSGLIGILLLAKEEGIIEKIGPLPDEMRNQGYWLSDKVVEAARLLAGEK